MQLFLKILQGVYKIPDPYMTLCYCTKTSGRSGQKKQSEAVETLKDTLCNIPILKCPDFKKEFHVYTDAFLIGISTG